jgi:hypothetical protein
VRRQLALEWGILPGRLDPPPNGSPELEEAMLRRAREVCGLASGAQVVLAHGPPTAGPGATNQLAVRRIP